MTEQEKQQKHSTSATNTEGDSALASTPNTAKNDQLKSDLDSLLDEIDEVLEDNAEEFVRNYIQKGGQ